MATLRESLFAPQKQTTCQSSKKMVRLTLFPLCLPSLYPSIHLSFNLSTHLPTPSSPTIAPLVFSPSKYTLEVKILGKFYQEKYLAKFSMKVKPPQPQPKK